jgi:hypothetical protein
LAFHHAGDIFDVILAGNVCSEDARAFLSVYDMLCPAGTVVNLSIKLGRDDAELLGFLRAQRQNLRSLTLRDARADASGVFHDVVTAALRSCTRLHLKFSNLSP